MIAKPDIPLGDMLNMAFMASMVVNGHGKAVVTETGMNTKVGKIANMIMEDETPENTNTKKLSQVGKILGIVCLAICVLIFAIGMIKENRPNRNVYDICGTSSCKAIQKVCLQLLQLCYPIGGSKMAKK